MKLIPKRLARSSAALLFTGVLFFGCGPIGYLSQVEYDARRAVARAQAASAERSSPYEYWSAVTYLHMAREKAAYGDYQLAIRYGERAQKMADRAVARKR